MADSSLKNRANTADRTSAESETVGNTTGNLTKSAEEAFSKIVGLDNAEELFKKFEEEHGKLDDLSGKHEIFRRRFNLIPNTTKKQEPPACVVKASRTSSRATKRDLFPLPQYTSLKLPCVISLALKQQIGSGSGFIAKYFEHCLAMKPVVLMKRNEELERRVVLLELERLVIVGDFIRQNQSDQTIIVGYH